MRVEIGKYRNWFGPYQFAKRVFFFLPESWQDSIGDFIPSAPFEWWDKHFKKRHVIIDIHDYDTWSADYTLAMVIHPVLVEFRKEENLNSYPMAIDPEDIPDSVLAISGSDQFELGMIRWKWILDEMIWAFVNILDEDSDTKFYNIEEKTMDIEKYKAHNQRIENGLRLFGKYYQNLWN